MAIDRRKYCEGICSEEYIQTGVPVEIRKQREKAVDPEEIERIYNELKEELGYE